VVVAASAFIGRTPTSFIAFVGLISEAGIFRRAGANFRMLVLLRGATCTHVDRRDGAFGRRISHLKRGYGLRRSRLKGQAGMKAWTAWAILTYNLDTLAIRAS
jgi:IS5 family transposase